jgi:hypothetical protein
VDALSAALSTAATDCMADALGLIGDVRAVEPLLGAFGAVSDDYRLTQLFLLREDKASFDSADPLRTVAASGDECPHRGRSTDAFTVDWEHRVSSIPRRLRDQAEFHRRDR